MATILTEGTSVDPSVAAAVEMKLKGTPPYDPDGDGSDLPYLPCAAWPSDHLPLVAEVVLSSRGLVERVAENVARAVACAAGLFVGVVALGIFGMFLVASAIRGTALERFINDTGELIDTVERGPPAGR